MPSAPSSPIPVSRTPSTRPGRARAADRMVTSILGMCLASAGSPDDTTARFAVTRRCRPAGATRTRPGREPLALGRLRHVEPAQRVEPIGERAGEPRRHVLDDDDRQRERGREPLQDPLDRRRAAGGRADHAQLASGGRRRVRSGPAPADRGCRRLAGARPRKAASCSTTSRRSASRSMTLKADLSMKSTAPVGERLDRRLRADLAYGRRA